MGRIGVALAFWIAFAIATPVGAADWDRVDPDDSTLWFDDSSVALGEEGDDFVYFDVYHGDWAGADQMSANARSLSYDCDSGDGYIWDPVIQEWDFSGFYTDHESLSELAFEMCFWLLP